MTTSLQQIRAQSGWTIEKCTEQLNLAEQENKTFLRQALLAQLVHLNNETNNHSQAIQIASQLIRELKKIDEKDLLVDVLVEESKAFYHLSNFTKSRASLTSARTIANSKYTPPRMQAELDLQSGILHAAEDRDFKTAYSYFFEAFEAFDTSNEAKKAQMTLKYMLLSKIMIDSADEVNSILAAKTALKYLGPEIEAMRTLANAAKKRSLADFNEVFYKYKEELRDDPVVQKHFNVLKEAMFEKELQRLIQPYSCVQLDHIAKCVGEDRVVVERKLCQMILDKKFSGCLQGDGLLVIFEREPVDRTYEMANETIHAMGEVLGALYDRAKKVKA